MGPCARHYPGLGGWGDRFATIAVQYVLGKSQEQSLGKKEPGALSGAAEWDRT